MEKMRDTYTLADTVISQDSSVNIVTRLQPGQPGFSSWQGEIFSPHHQCPDKIFDLHILTASVYSGVFPEKQRLGHKTVTPPYPMPRLRM
jgi:hypothetical protein